MTRHTRTVLLMVALVLAAAIAYETYAVYMIKTLVLPYCPPDPKECS